jgi:hypothetical protein
MISTSKRLEQRETLLVSFCERPMGLRWEVSMVGPGEEPAMSAISLSPRVCAAKARVLGDAGR